ncbi:MFS transporter [uncultured Aeromicrobium sp.]|uniref:MFS transporter n=1 Tax=uncultured Aeromicrobium sp. TaxID=337820 RepID=UPI0025F57956|nr:MFS transporter [uncultured Aeromicrobium sp.]
MTASTAGQVLEWYEWSVYAAFAPIIAAVMFDSDDPVSALLSTLAVFAVGFLMRPLGGYVFGRLADQRGRKFVLMATMLTMAAGSVVIGLMPTYSSIGVWASVLLLAVRMAQGFAHGGESATANSYVAEIAPVQRRGMWSSVLWISIYAGSVLAFLVSALLASVMSEATLEAWGWRIPFLLGALGAVTVMYMRRGMDESHAYTAAVEVTSSTGPVADAASSSVGRTAVTKAVLVVIAMTSGLTVVHYTWTSYVSTYAIAERSMDPSGAYWAATAAQAIALVALPLWGRLSDVVGRRPMLLAFAPAMAVLQVPLMRMISDDPWTLFASATVALLLVTAPGAMLGAVMSELFPTRIRAQAIGFAYSVSVAVFGGSAPYLNQWAIAHDLELLKDLYIIALCLATGIAGWVIRETKGAGLNEAGMDRSLR